MNNYDKFIMELANEEYAGDLQATRAACDFGFEVL